MRKPRKNYTAEEKVAILKRYSVEKTEIAICALILWLGIGFSKFYSWRKRYGQANEHNARVAMWHENHAHASRGHAGRTPPTARPRRVFTAG